MLIANVHRDKKKQPEAYKATDFVLTEAPGELNNSVSKSPHMTAQELREKINSQYFIGD